MNPKLTTLVASLSDSFILKDCDTSIHLLPCLDGIISTSPLEQVRLADRVRSRAKSLNLSLCWGGAPDINQFTYSVVPCSTLHLVAMNRLKSKCLMPYLDLTLFKLSKKELKGMNLNFISPNHSGSRNPAAKINEDMAHNICILLSSSDLSYTQIAMKLKVSRNTVVNIATHKTWLHISQYHHFRDRRPLWMK